MDWKVVTFIFKSIKVIFSVNGPFRQKDKDKRRREKGIFEAYFLSNYSLFNIHKQFVSIIIQFISYQQAIYRYFIQTKL